MHPGLFFTPEVSLMINKVPADEGVVEKGEVEANVGEVLGDAG